MTTRSRVTQRPTAAQLEGRLTLLSWLHDLLGYDSTKALLDDVKQADEGFDANGRSHVHARLASRAGQMRGVTVADLEHYDDNIREHLAAMNEGRTQPITLRYFQYLAALYTEIFLDRYSQSPAKLLDSLNKHVNRLKERRLEGVKRYKQSDLQKLAFWMATGSGKTLLMHLNYRQYLHYEKQPLDNVPPHYAHRGPQPAAPGRAAGVQHPRQAIRPEREPAVWRRSQHGPGHRDHQARDREDRPGRERAGRGLRRP